jgi:hypothetical protein
MMVVRGGVAEVHSIGGRGIHGWREKIRDIGKKKTLNKRKPESSRDAALHQEGHYPNGGNRRREVGKDIA